ncbi:uracil phosphoribosyltransferase [Sinomicrobium weinanense]|uniref:Uracil phosphoribosyltransferase n=1 Tax=Sinomicrobium weinanense TaxID=2842200 RepID=A0A926Q3D4_9FLAO|nr:uracil phosphoribosyltransferase [Sinomicrobium weinanense]MBC9797453.1 uracil phosphoribosyltransferase [Sinomicrobium weinanense]MBU3125471.1 uracil phosphoribosyltransferase [Sinomicrobium weinanense]
MNLHHIGAQHSILNHFIAESRDRHIQADRMRFRKNMERIGEILGYELSKTLSYHNKSIATPLGAKNVPLVTDEIVICSILRAGIPFHNGLLNYFDHAENAFISAYRHHTGNDDDFEIVVEYLSSPSLEGKTLLLADPMLATGQSLIAVYEALKKLGTPSEIHLLAVIGAQAGIARVKEHFPTDTHLWIAAIDDELNDKGYIVPGLGDAGDLAYGTKLQH